MRGLKLRQVETFCELARQGSLALTAERLSLTQSAVSVSVRELERQLGVSLFNKQGRRLMLSDRGRELLPQALALMERAESFGDAGAAHGSHSMAIGGTRSIGPHILPGLIEAFESLMDREFGGDKSPHRGNSPATGNVSKERQGRRQYELFIQNSEAVLTRLADRSLDLAFVEGEVIDPTLHKRAWLKDQLVIFCRAGHPILAQRAPWEHFDKSSWALREAGSGTRELFLRALAPQWPTLNIEVETSDNATLSEIVARSDRLGCLSRRVIHGELLSGKLVEINTRTGTLEKRLLRNLWIVTHPQRHQRPIITRFLQFALAWENG